MDRTLSLAEAHEFVARALEANRTAPKNAASVARALVAAEADGLKGHGLSRVPSYAAQSKSGKVDGFAEPSASVPRPAVLAIDAAHGFAYPALDLAIARLPALAIEQGVAVAPIRRSHHCGAAGIAVERLANAGVATLMFANTPQAIAPWGGKRALFGTNPIAFAMPLPGRAPLVIDLSLSKVARGNIVSASQRREPIPEGWALDAEGNPTTDPAAALKGTMVPMGDAKGTALALMVEILAAGLTGANFASAASSFFEADGPAPGTGQLLIALSPEALGGAAVAEHVLSLVTGIEAEAGARVPGARRLVLRKKAEAEGVKIPASLYDEIEKLSRPA